MATGPLPVAADRALRLSRRNSRRRPKLADGRGQPLFHRGLTTDSHASDFGYPYTPVEMQGNAIEASLVPRRPARANSRSWIAGARFAGEAIPIHGTDGVNHVIEAEGCIRR